MPPIGGSISPFALITGKRPVFRQKIAAGRRLYRPGFLHTVVSTTPSQRDATFGNSAAATSSPAG
jgi:hypothetical protein